MAREEIVKDRQMRAEELHPTVSALAGGSRPKRARRWLRQGVCASVLGIGLQALSGAALAQEDPQQKAAAEALFNEGQEALFERDYEAACRRFEQSQAIDPGVGTLLYLGDCYERLGRLASSWATYREAESAARAAGQAERSRVAHERAARLLPHLPKLSLGVAPENRVAGFELTINGKPLNSALFDVPFPVDAGRYELVAQAPGRLRWSSLIEVPAGGEPKSVQVPVLEKSGAEPSLAASSFRVAAADTAGAGGAGPVADSGFPLSSRQTAGLVVAGGGVLATLGGVLFGVSAKNKDDEAKPYCPSGCATLAAAALNEDARTLATFANISYVVGGLAITTGAVLFFLPEEEAATVAEALPFDVSAELAPGRQVVTLGGAF
jgi:tetratricopeptide (TPR) repeat protein